jgi:hypothetical protein
VVLVSDGHGREERRGSIGVSGVDRVIGGLTGYSQFDDRRPAVGGVGTRRTNLSRPNTSTRTVMLWAETQPIA